MANSGGNVFFVPPEYYGIAGLGNALQQGAAVYKEQKRYKEEKEDKEKQQAFQNSIAKYNVLRDMGADQATLLRFTQEAGLTGEGGVKLNFDPDAFINNMLGEYLQMTPEQQASAPPMMRYLANQQLFKSVIPPEMQIGMENLRMENLTGQNELLAGNITAQDIENWFSENNKREYQQVAGSLDELFVRVKRPDLVGTGLTGLKTYESEIGIKNAWKQLDLLDANFKNILANTELTYKRIEQIDAEIAAAGQQKGLMGPTGELVMSKAKALAERTPGLTDPRFALSYVLGEEVPPTVAAVLRGAETALQQEVDAIANAAVRKAMEEGNETVSDLNALLSVMRASPELAQSLQPFVTDLTSKFINELVPGAVQLSRHDPWWGQPNIEMTADIEAILGSGSITRAVTQTLQDLGGTLGNNYSTVEGTDIVGLTDDMLEVHGGLTPALEFTRNKAAELESMGQTEAATLVRSIEAELVSRGEVPSETINPTLEDPVVANAPKNIFEADFTKYSIEELEAAHKTLVNMSKGMSQTMRNAAGENVPLMEMMRMKGERHKIAQRAGEVIAEIERRKRGQR